MGKKINANKTAKTNVAPAYAPTFAFAA